MWYLYEYWDSNGWCKLMGINIYKIREDDSIAVNQTKNEHEKDNEKEKEPFHME